ncbi:MAG: hypothetical protein KAT79_02815 [candidate division Zixibacteria bacterium]|nr:hypothetical protein [candidate division Zixibacteria bacterium]
MACHKCDLTLSSNMGLRLQNQGSGSCFFVTTTFREWRRFGDVPEFYARLASSFAFCLEKYEAVCIAYAFMPSHIHAILILKGDCLAPLTRDFKKFVAQKVAVDLRLGTTSIWMPRYDRVAIYSEEVLRTKLQYVHNNPVKAGLVSQPEDWMWSSAADYMCDRPGPVPIWKDWG